MAGLFVLRLITLGRLELRRDGSPPELVVLQPKRLALLAYLARGSEEAYHRRDILLTLFWPEHNHTQARHALRHAVYHLRNVLGDGMLVSRGSEEIGLTKRVWCDADAFEDALAAGRAADALALYRGEFFAGVFVGGASPDWEEWVSRMRARLRARAAAAAWTVAELALRSGDVPHGLAAAQRARELDPDDEPGLQRLMQWLNHFGRRTTALQAFGDFTRWLRSEYQAEPSVATRALAEAIRLSPGLALDGDRITGAPQSSPGRPYRPSVPNGWRLRTAARRRRALGRLPAAVSALPIAVSDPMFDIESPR